MTGARAEIRAQQDAEAPMRQLRCHRCGSPKLVLFETRHDVAQWGGGLYLTRDGEIEAAGIAYFHPGEIQPRLTEIRCEACGHAWHPRRWFRGEMKQS